MNAEDTDIDDVLAEILDRRAAGEDPSAEVYLAKYPQFAERLTQHFDTLRALDSLITEKNAVPDRDAILGDYKIIQEIGRGGMGVVFLAEQMSLKRLVALKVLDARYANNFERLERFRREAKLAAKLRHPNIITIYDADEAEGFPYYAMEYSRGVPLSGVVAELRKTAMDDFARADLPAVIRTLMSQKPVAETEFQTVEAARPLGYFGCVAEIVAGAAEGLDYAHSRNVVHRDVKPHNILVDERLTAEIVDFGVAKELNADTLSITHDPIGTPYYMSPEQVAGKLVELNARTDVYSLGVTLYELLTLRVPFSGKTSREVQTKIMFEPPQSPRHFNPAVPIDLQTIALKAMEKNPKNRYASAHAMAEDLKRFLRLEPIEAKPPSAVERGRRFLLHHKWAAGAAAVAAILAVAGIVTMREVQAETQMEATIAHARSLAGQGAFKDAIALIDASPSAVRSRAKLVESRRELFEKNAAEVERNAKNLRFEVDEARKGSTGLWGAAALHAAALQRLVFDDAAILSDCREVLGPYTVTIRVNEPNAKVDVEYINTFTALSTALQQSISALPGRNEIVFELGQGTYRFVVIGKEGFGEYVRTVGRGSLTIDAELLRTSDVTRDMVLVPAGEYPIGWEDPKIGEILGPRHVKTLTAKQPGNVKLEAFYIDKYCVSNKQFEEFYRARGRAMKVPWPGNWMGEACPPEYSKGPVCVPYASAVAYAEWAGKRLPADDEWEAAARGKEGRLYTWGNDSDPTRVPKFTKKNGAPRIQDFADVDAFPEGDTPEGVRLMLGNVLEWTACLWIPRPDAPRDSWVWQDAKRSVRGVLMGDFGKGVNLNNAYRGFESEVQGYPYVGFRCAKSAK